MGFHMFFFMSCHNQLGYPPPGGLWWGLSGKEVSMLFSFCWTYLFDGKKIEEENSWGWASLHQFLQCMKALPHVFGRWIDDLSFFNKQYDIYKTTFTTIKYETHYKFIVILFVWVERNTCKVVNVNEWCIGFLVL